jgi:V/A-type H+-transporting ATPase subunit K
MRTFGKTAATALIAGWAAATVASAQEAAVSGAAGGADTGIRAAGIALAAALVMGLSVCGAGLAVGRIGSAALGAAAEKPELLTRSLLFVALAEGLAVLGFAVAIMLTQKI